MLYKFRCSLLPVNLSPLVSSFLCTVVHGICTVLNGLTVHRPDH
jgi:hypothetical protein